MYYHSSRVFIKTFLSIEIFPSYVQVAIMSSYVDHPFDSCTAPKYNLLRFRKVVQVRNKYQSISYGN